MDKKLISRLSDCLFFVLTASLFVLGVWYNSISFVHLASKDKYAKEVAELSGRICPTEEIRVGSVVIVSPLANLNPWLLPAKRFVPAGQKFRLQGCLGQNVIFLYVNEQVFQIWAAPSFITYDWPNSVTALLAIAAAVSLIYGFSVLLAIWKEGLWPTVIVPAKQIW